jgi:hypothetical protein
VGPLPVDEEKPGRRCRGNPWARAARAARTAESLPLKLVFYLHDRVAMRGVMVCAAAVVIAGCGASGDPYRDCRDPRQIVAPSSSGEPGTVLAGSLFSYIQDGAIAARPDGSIVCLTCSGAVVLDRMEPQPDVVGAPFAVAPDGSIYVHTFGAVVALAPSGEQRWVAPITGAPGRLVARAEGAYLNALQLRGPREELVILGFDAATGAQRVVATGQDLLGAVAGGILAVENQRSKSVTLNQLDPAGQVVWSHTLTSTDTGLEIKGAAASPDGGAVVFGTTPKALDLGDRTLPSLVEDRIFIATFDAAGATVGAFIDDQIYVRYLAVTTRGEIALATYYDHAVGVGDSESVLATATPDGIQRTIHIDGPGSQSVQAIAAAPDGAVWIQINQPPSEDGWPDPEMQLGDRTFSETGIYLFKLAI